MKLLADESVDHPIVVQLRREGHEVLSIAELSPSITDREVLERANAEQALLLTGDKDFGELVFRQGLLHYGVVLLRLSGAPAAEKASLVSGVFRDHAEKLPAAFTVVSRSMVRIRQRL